MSATASHGVHYRDLIERLRGDAANDDGRFSLLHGWARRRLEAQGLPVEQAQDKVADDIFDGRAEVFDADELFARDDSGRGAGYARTMVRQGRVAYAAGEHRLAWLDEAGYPLPKTSGYDLWLADLAGEAR